jgi:hypothetical protein
MKTVLIISAFISICAVQAGATDVNSNQNGTDQSFEQKRSEVLQHIQERISNSQAEITCVTAAQSRDELRSCHDKYRPARKNEKRNQGPQQ